MGEEQIIILIIVCDGKVNIVLAIKKTENDIIVKFLKIIYHVTIFSKMCI